MKFVGGGGAVSPDVSIVMQNGGDLYIKNLSLSTTSDRSLIDFQGSSSTLHFAGNNTLESNGTYSESSSGNSKKAVIHTGGDLQIYGEDTSGKSGKLRVFQPKGSLGACIGTNGAYSSGDPDDPATQTNITIMSGTLNLIHNGMSGVAIGTDCAWNNQFGNITINDGYVNIRCDQTAITIGAD